MQEEEAPCERNASRAAGRALMKAFYENPLIGGRQVSKVVPAGCPLDINTHIYAAQERQRTLRADGLWRCGYCHKTFVSEPYLDQHMDRRHQAELPSTDSKDGVCLGRLCSFLPCHHHGGPPNVVVVEGRKGGTCNVERVEEARRACQAAILGCFPLDQAPRPAAINEYLNHQLCDPLHCDANSQAPSSSASSHFHFTWRPPHPYSDDVAGHLTASAGFLTVLLIVTIMGLRNYIYNRTVLPLPDLRRPPSSSSSGGGGRYSSRRPWGGSGFTSAWSSGGIGSSSRRSSSSKRKLG